ncbi:hypothetical protein Hamer_G001418 [Homarus americanus]|uniref:Uncharacterized protein n=1 Tax=Homarus americanus TaxID=6706 RepID=A0A8J5N9P4_HOMAM|nr:hypothetical protein Hamer_G001418 [Homarus americanus]
MALLLHLLWVKSPWLLLTYCWGQEFVLYWFDLQKYKGDVFCLPKKASTDQCVFS